MKNQSTAFARTGWLPVLFFASVFFSRCSQTDNKAAAVPGFVLHAADTIYFNSFVDCNMAEAWVGDSFRIFPGKYGEDPVWGAGKDLKFASGLRPEEVFRSSPQSFTEPLLPPNVAPGQEGLHGAVWFETIYQDPLDSSGRTLYAIYHNENYPATLPYDSVSGEGYRSKNWPEGLRGDTTPAAVCRIGIMKSTDGGRSWNNRGLFLEDLQPRMILRPYNRSVTFAGGVGDPSAVASGEYLYLFYGEYGYPGNYDSSSYDPEKERSGQCISVARIALKDLDNPTGKARRWDGQAFNAAYNGIGKPIASLQIPVSEGGGPTSAPDSKYYWGPSVSWNSYLKCWVMLMARAEGPSWKGSNIYISFNSHPDLGLADQAQQWSAPQLLLSRPGHVLWYPSLQPLDSTDDVLQKNTSLRLAQKARLFVKDQQPDGAQYLSTHVIEFRKPEEK